MNVTWLCSITQLGITTRRCDGLTKACRALCVAWLVVVCVRTLVVRDSRRTLWLSLSKSGRLATGR